MLLVSKKLGRLDELTPEQLKDLMAAHNRVRNNSKDFNYYTKAAPIHNNDESHYLSLSKTDFNYPTDPNHKMKTIFDEKYLNKYYDPNRNRPGNMNDNFIKVYNYKNLTNPIGSVIVVNDNHKYEPHIYSQGCVAQHNNMILEIIHPLLYPSCSLKGLYQDFFFEKHCVISKHLATKPKDYIFIVIYT